MARMPRSMRSLLAYGASGDEARRHVVGGHSVPCDLAGKNFVVRQP